MRMRRTKKTRCMKGINLPLTDKGDFIQILRSWAREFGSKDFVFGSNFTPIPFSPNPKGTAAALNNLKICKAVYSIAMPGWVQLSVSLVFDPAAATNVLIDLPIPHADYMPDGKIVKYAIGVSDPTSSGDGIGVMRVGAGADNRKAECYCFRAGTATSFDKVGSEIHINIIYLSDQKGG